MTAAVGPARWRQNRSAPVAGGHLRAARECGAVGAAAAFPARGGAPWEAPPARVHRLAGELEPPAGPGLTAYHPARCRPTATHVDRTL